MLVIRVANVEADVRNGRSTTTLQVEPIFSVGAKLQTDVEIRRYLHGHTPDFQTKILLNPG